MIQISVELNFDNYANQSNDYEMDAKLFLN